MTGIEIYITQSKGKITNKLKREYSNLRNTIKREKNKQIQTKIQSHAIQLKGKRTNKSKREFKYK